VERAGAARTKAAGIAAAPSAAEWPRLGAVRRVECAVELGPRRRLAPERAVELGPALVVALALVRARERAEAAGQAAV